MNSSYGGGDSLPSGPDGVKRRVAYFYDPDIGGFSYGQGHSMKPIRISMANNLIENYSLDKKMEICRPLTVTAADMARFHSDEYVNSLYNAKPSDKFHLGEDDCPVFDGLYDFCKISAGGSVGAAVKLNRGETDIAINWAGGLHHAKKSGAYGFCFVNDIVLGIFELLKTHRRVMYIDIDVHHGDGVEEAFYTTDRVMTVSFHKYDGKRFFPRTGDMNTVGSGLGRNYSLNVPLDDGMDDLSFGELFRPIIKKAMEVYKPEAVVLQCGADSLSGDRLGCFNLSVKGHSDCLRFVRSFNVPLMVLGGGGYTLRNVARCWCYETAVALGEELENELPVNDYYEYFGPEYTLHVEPGKMKNMNSASNLEKIKVRLLEQLSRLPHVPSVQFHTPSPGMGTSEQPEEDMEWRSSGGGGYGSETESDD